MAMNWYKHFRCSLEEHQTSDELSMTPNANNLVPTSSIDERNQSCFDKQY